MLISSSFYSVSVCLLFFKCEDAGVSSVRVSIERASEFKIQYYELFIVLIHERVQNQLIIIFILCTATENYYV